METFIHKTVSESITIERAKARAIECVACRTRTSAGFGAIEVRIDGAVALNINSDTYGHNYEQVAIQIAELLTKVAKTPCTIPAS